jgi:hypothetical protein
VNKQIPIVGYILFWKEKLGIKNTYLDVNHPFFSDSVGIAWRGIGNVEYNKIKHNPELAGHGTYPL